MYIKKICVLALLIIATSVSWSCMNCVKGTGDIVTKTISVEPFHSFEVSGSTDVFIKQGTEQLVEIKGHPNVIAILKTEINNGLWTIDFNECIRSGVEVYITVPDLKGIAITGSGSVTGSENLNVQDINLSIAGSGDINLMLNAQNVTSEIAGSGDIDLTGSATSHSISIAGSGNVKADEFLVLNSKIKIAGSGDVKINTTELLEVSIAGSGDVNYKGNPAKVKSEIIGSGELIKH